MPEHIRPLRMGMVGGGSGAFIGAVHRMAAALDHSAVLTAGALSSTPDKARASALALGLPDDRSYPSWQEMLQRELARPPGERIELVSIVTPNHAHFEPARAFAQAGIHVICDKPLALDTAQAHALIQAQRSSGVVFAVTYNYSGYPLVLQAQHLVRTGALGEIRKVIVEYNQGWLATNLESTGQKQADWRTDPARSGLGGAIGDIGSHAEQLVSTVTGLELESVCADLTSFVPGRRLDDDANVLLRFAPAAAPAAGGAASGGGARGILTASQVCVGRENDLRLRVWGTNGGLTWHQEDPSRLVVDFADRPSIIYTRGGPGLCELATLASRLPPGHPEAFIEAFANIYRAACDEIRRKSGLPTSLRSPMPFPTVIDGARGVSFIHAVVAASASTAKWTPARWIPPHAER